MSKRITKEEKEDLEKKIMDFANKHGSFCVNAISQQYDVKWETVNTSVQKLVSEGRLFVIAGTENPKIFTIWPSADLKRTRKTVLATLENRNRTGENDCLYACPQVPHLRASDHDDIRKSIGFVCHPSVKGKEVDIEYHRAHWRGSFVVEVKKQGKMLESWKLDDAPITGSWKVTPMSGNLKCNGRVHLPDDPEAFSISALTYKDGTIKRLNVYVHSRYIYYKASDRTALAEFHQQVDDILTVLGRFGWEFENIIDKGKCDQLHRAMNDIKLGTLAMKGKYEDRETDMVHFDCSHGTPEAEVYGASDEANATIEFLTNPLPVISAIRTEMKELGDGVIEMSNTVKIMGSTMGNMAVTMGKVLEVLAQQSEILVKLTEVNGSSIPYAPASPDDGIAYGRADL